MGDAELSLWTTSLDHFATGEGRTMMARVCCARDEASARQQFGEAFDPLYAKRCSVQRGLVRNEVTRFLWSNPALDYFEQLGAGGCVEANSFFHFNLS